MLCLELLVTQAGPCPPRPSVFPFGKWGWYLPLQEFTRREDMCCECTLAGCWDPRKALDPPCPVRVLVQGQDGQGRGVVRVRGEMRCVVGTM